MVSSLSKSLSHITNLYVVTPRPGYHYLYFYPSKVDWYQWSLRMVPMPESYGKLIGKRRYRRLSPMVPILGSYGKTNKKGKCLSRARLLWNYYITDTLAHHCKWYIRYLSLFLTLPISMLSPLDLDNIICIST